MPLVLSLSNAALLSTQYISLVSWFSYINFRKSIVKTKSKYKWGFRKKQITTLVFINFDSKNKRFFWQQPHSSNLNMAEALVQIKL